MTSNINALGARALTPTAHLTWAAVCMAGILLTACTQPSMSSPGNAFEVRTLSTDPLRVTGGNVLLEILAPPNETLEGITVSIDGRPISGPFRADPSDHTLTGNIEGLALGDNTLTVVSMDGNVPKATLRLVNHPITGPVFSGPHQQPFVCETEGFVLPVTGDILGPSLDVDCSATTRTDYVYMPTSGVFSPLPDQTMHPDDLTETLTTDGRTVPYIVRVETGTINRAIYQIAILHDPATDPTSDPWTRPAGWNGRLIYSFGGGYQATFHQGRRTAGVLNPLFLSQGYAVASSSLNVARNNSNDVTSAETAMMVKEHFIEQFGQPRHTIGWGSSGGAMQQHHITLNYPGILDGIIPAAASPDTVTRVGWVSDCALLERYFETADNPWTDEQKTAVSGFATWEVCTGGPSFTGSAWLTSGYSPGWIDPTACDESIPQALIYDPVENPGGARCTFQDNLVNIFGHDPDTGFARRPIDNIGVQYGLSAFKAGKISVEQFIELNERIGGFDIDAHIVAERTAGDLEAIQIAYETGRINGGGGGMAFTPIIDIRQYQDPFDFHDRVRAFATKARLIATNGHADNRVMLTTSVAWGLEMVRADALQMMDLWLENIAKDHAPGSTNEKVVRNKPADLVDACYTDEGEKISEPALYDEKGVCNQLYPPHGDSRIAAGASVAGDIMKCTLKPFNPKGYSKTLTASQLQRLNQTFPDGVCDWSAPGVGQHPLKDTWLSF